MRILHTYCLNYNLGDYALGMGLKNLLRKYLDVTLIGETNLQGRYFDQYYIDEVVNKKYDLLVVGGGGIIHGAHWPNGWFWLIDRDLIQRIKIPFIVYSAGYNYWQEEGGMPERGIEHIKETIKHATYFSLRKDGSAERFLSDTGLSISDIPDPGFHIALGESTERYVSEPYVMIQLADDKSSNRFASTGMREAFIQNLIDIGCRLSKKYKVVLSPHVVHDLPLSRFVAQAIPNSEVWDFGQVAFDHADRAVGYYEHAAFVLAMRGHGQIVPIGFGTPAIALENHPKHRGLMEKLGLNDLSVPISSSDFPSQVMQCIGYIEDQIVEVHQRLAGIRLNLAKESAEAFHQIKSNL